MPLAGAPPRTVDAAEVWEDFHASLLAFIARRVRDRDSAEDILQEVMLRIHRHAGELERSAAVGAWVHQITRNAIADHYRRASGRRERPSGIDLDRQRAGARGRSGGASQRARRLPAAHCWSGWRRSKGMRSRSPKWRGSRRRRAAAQLGLSSSGMKSRVQRGRAQLKELLTACCEIELDRRGAVRSYRPLGGTCDCRTETPVRPER